MRTATKTAARRTAPPRGGTLFDTHTTTPTTRAAAKPAGKTAAERKAVRDAEVGLRRHLDLSEACKAAYQEMDALLPIIVDHYGIGETIALPGLPAVAILDQLAEKDFAFKTVRFNRYTLKTLSARAAGKVMPNDE